MLITHRKKETMTVYITQDIKGRDFTDARKYGDIVWLVPPIEQATLSFQPPIRRMLRSLVEFTDKDFLLLSGDPVVIATAAAIAAHNNEGRFKVLKWDRMTARYLPIQVDLTLKKGVESVI
jgi:hypothetical protein